MGVGIYRSMGYALQLLILIFSACFVYFTFVYYPKVASRVNLALPFNLFEDKVIVGAESFPITTESYKLTYETESSIYYAFIEGETLDKFVQNKLASQLALKNTLQLDYLCDLKIIYTSTRRLELGREQTETTGC